MISAFVNDGPSTLYMSQDRGEIGELASEKTLTRLIVSCDDPRLDQHALPGLVNDNTLLLRGTGPTISGEEGRELWETVRETLKIAPIEQIILCGHSWYARGPRIATSHYSSNGMPVRDDGLLGRLAIAQNRLADSKRQLVSEVQWLASQPEIESRLADGQFEILTLLYLFESGLFLSYNRDQSGFSPVVDSPVLG